MLTGDLLIDLSTEHISVGFSGGANKPVSVPLPPFRLTPFLSLCRSLP